MPRVFDIGSYSVYFWSNEGGPIEPIHVHVSEGIPNPNGTKIWITEEGHALLCHNGSRIPNRDLNYIIRVIEAQKDIIIQEWQNRFGIITYYC